MVFLRKHRNSSQTCRLQLYDDGLHDDGEENDNLYAGYIKHPGIEDLFEVCIVSHNIDLNEKFYSGQDCRSVTTIGPVEVNNYTIIKQELKDKNETQLSFSLDLINTGKSTSTQDLKIELFSSSDFIRIIDESSECQAINPGQTQQCNSEFSLHISPDHPSPKAIEIQVSISMDGSSYWNQMIEIQIGR